MTEQQWLEYDDTRLESLRSALRTRGCNERQIVQATNRAREIINLLGRVLCPGDEFGHALTAAQIIVETNMTIFKQFGPDALNDFVAVMIKHRRLRLTRDGQIICWDLGRRQRNAAAAVDRRALESPDRAVTTDSEPKGARES